jgi:hypothetical protein
MLDKRVGEPSHESADFRALRKDRFLLSLVNITKTSRDMNVSLDLA